MVENVTGILGGIHLLDLSYTLHKLLEQWLVAVGMICHV